MQAMDDTSTPIPVTYAPGHSTPVIGSGPFPHAQGMSPTLTAVFEDQRQDNRGSLQGVRGFGSQLPVGYGATAGSSLMNGTAAAPSLGTTPAASAAAAVDVDLGASEVASATAARETGPVATRVQGRVSQQYAHTPAPTNTSSAPADPAPVQQQIPHAPLLDRVPQPPEPSVPVSGESVRAEHSAGTRISLEAQRAMAQLASQRTALVQALQQRASRASSAFAVVEGEGGGSATANHAREARLEEPNEEVVWYSRLQGFLRRRVVEPVREQVESM